MLIGHYAVAFVGRGILREKPQAPSLGTWVLAAQWLDLLWPILVVTGIERLRIVGGSDPFLHIDFTYYPWSHSLLAAIVWAALFAVLYGWRTRNQAAALWVAGGVVSHWALDFIVHVPDLPLYPGSPVKLGMGLWHSVAGTVVVEGGMFLLAVAWYGRRTRALDSVGRWAFWTFAALLAVVYGASLVGPPPPNEMAVGASALLLWLLVPWAYWIDRHRGPIA